MDDTRLLRNDPGLRQLVFPHLPAANSFGRFLRRFGRRALYQLGELLAGQAVSALKPGQTVTLDMDSTTIESDKDAAQMTYKGFRGYNPLLAWLAETVYAPWASTARRLCRHSGSWSNST